MFEVGAQLRVLEDLARQAVICRVLADATLEGGRAFAQVELLGVDAEQAICEVAGGLRTPYGLPREGEVWIGLAIGQGLSEVWLLLAVPFEDDAPDGLALGQTVLAPPRGETLRLIVRAASGVEDAPEVASELDPAGQITIRAGGAQLQIDAQGRIRAGNEAAEVVSSLVDTLGWISATLGDLAGATVPTLLGPQALSNASLYTSRKLLIDQHIIALKTLLL